MLWALLGVLALLALGLVPFAAQVSLDAGRRPMTIVTASWGGLRLPTAPAGAGRREGKAPKSEESKTERRQSFRAARVRRRQILRALRTRGLMSALRRGATRLLRHLRPRDVRMQIVVGLGDPAETGRLWGTLSPLVALLGALDAGAVVLAPDFDRARFEVSGQARVRVVPAYLVAIACATLLCEPSVWRAAWRLWRA